MPAEYAELDRILVAQATQVMADARELRGSLAVQFRMGLGERLLPELCGRLERARALAAVGKVKEAGAAYQALLLALQVVHLAVAVHLTAEQADFVGQPGFTIDETLSAFADQLAPLLAAALTEDPRQIQQALQARGDWYGTWVHSIGVWSSKTAAGAKRMAMAKRVWDMAMLVMATYEAAVTAGQIAAGGRPPMPPLPSVVLAGGRGAAGITAARYAELAEALRKLIASGAIDGAVVAGLSTMLGKPGGPPAEAVAGPPGNLMMGNEVPQATSAELDPRTTPVFRGGTSMAVKPNEVRVDANGQVRSTHGLSLNTDPRGLERFGGARQVKSIPAELKIVQRGQNPSHYEIVPRRPMSLSEFQRLLNEVELRQVPDGI
jgi:hypothetical protein